MSETQLETTYLLISGLGSPRPGAIRDDFASALLKQCADRSFTTGQDSIAAAPPPSVPTNGKREPDVFPLPWAEGSDGTWRAAELYWDDIRPVHRSALWIGVGLLKLMFGLRHLITPLTEGAPGGRYFRAAAWWFFQIVRGPVTAFTLYTAILALAATPAYAIGSLLHLTQPLQWWGPVVLGVIAAPIAMAICQRALRETFLRNWLALATTAGTLIAITGHYAGNLGPVESVAMVMVAAWAVLNGYWLIVYALGTVAGVRGSGPDRRGVVATLGCITLSLGIWTLVVPSFSLTVSNLIPAEYRYGGLDTVLHASLPTVGFAWTAWLLLITAVSFTMVARWIALKFKRNKLPRLVVGGVITFLLVVVPLPLMIVHISNAPDFISKLAGAPTSEGGLLAAFIGRLNGVAIASIPAVAALFWWQRDLLRIGTDTALDVVNYFDTTRTPFEEPRKNATRQDALTSPDPTGLPPKNEWIPPHANVPRPVPALLVQRFRAALEHLARRPKSRLVVVAHSQGTLIAARAMFKDGCDQELASYNQVHLVTMGSPLSHLYDHYMREFFDKSDVSVSARCAGSWLQSWTNLYRVDDYIGTEVEVMVSEEKFVERPIGDGGHAGYFSDPDVIKALQGIPA